MARRRYEESILRELPDRESRTSGRSEVAHAERRERPKIVKKSDKHFGNINETQYWLEKMKGRFNQGVTGRKKKPPPTRGTASPFGEKYKPSKRSRQR